MPCGIDGGYDDPITKSRRLWRYQKGRSPYPNASPRTATRWDGHFADPADSAKEAEIEVRLKREFEDPVNEFIEIVGYSTFALTPFHIRALAAYMRMLFNRTRARRSASEGQAETRRQAMRTLIANEEWMSAMVGKHTMDVVASGHPEPRMVTREEIVEVVERIIEKHSGVDEAQHGYAETVQTMMTFPDNGVLHGQWELFRTTPDKPFVIGDAPVVTWERSDRNTLHWGVGFARPNVEAFLPLSPAVCVRVLPVVPRTRLVLTPTAGEVNMAQAAFATDYCFSNICNPEVDATMQPHFGTMRMGIDGFSTNHIDAATMLFNILMNQGQPVMA